MAFSPKKLAVIVAALGILSFVFGILAEHNKPAKGEAVQGKGVVICKYPSDPSIVYGYLSTGFLLLCTATGYFSVFYPYQGKAVPVTSFFRSRLFNAFFNISWLTAGLAAALLLYTTIREQHLVSWKVRSDLETTCETAKTGVLGGAAFASLDSCLFWLISLMLTTNIREDYFDENEEAAAKHKAAGRTDTLVNVDD